MPIKPENKHRYPANWRDIRARILLLAKNKCQFCGVENGAIGARLSDGSWGHAHACGEKMLRTEWPEPGTVWWCGGKGLAAERHRIIKIVLTIAHLDHQPENNSDENLRALCQKCHLTYDAKHHAETAYRTRKNRALTNDMFESQ